MCMYHSNTNYTSALAKLNNNANANTFLSDYGKKAYFLTWSGYGYLNAYGSSLLHNGSSYYLAGTNTPSGYASDWLAANAQTSLWGYNPKTRNYELSTGALGVRPIVVLKDGVGAVKSNGVWNLTLGVRDMNDDDYSTVDDIANRTVGEVVYVESLYE